ncbi:glutamine synthetase family protein [Actibacterium pelagium]|nr:glutamine synthetase family protein [Actibacterium pelagium]
MISLFGKGISTMPANKPKDWLKANPDIDWVIVAVCDLNGVLRGKRVPRNQVRKALKGGVRMPLSACAVDIWGRDIAESELVFESGDADGICAPTERGIVLRNWKQDPSALLQVTMAHEDGTPVQVDARQALATVVSRFAEAGLTLVVATELEFYLTKSKGGTVVPSDGNGNTSPSDNVLSVSELDSLTPFLDDVYAACEALDIPADAAISEAGAGQVEINILHTDDAMKAADDALQFKNIVKDVADKHGLTATFMAKPFGDQPGNGFHVHFSLLDSAGKNVFDDGTEEGSQMLRHAVGGILSAMQESTLIFAPHLNSFRRIRPGSHAPTGAGWGYENRTCAVRIPGGPNEARRIEHRVAGADTNPYLVLAAIFGAAFYGITQKTEPSAPIEGNAYDASLPSLPLGWNSAIARFQSGEILPTIFSPMLLRLFAQTKQQELGHFLSEVTELEYQTYLETV